MITTGLSNAARLHRVVADGTVADVERLLDDEFVGVDARDSFGFTPLHRACALARASVIRVLLARGAKMSATTQDDDEPGPLQNLDVFLHARQRHPKLFGKTADRRVRSTKLFDDPATGRIRERREGKIERRC